MKAVGQGRSSRLGECFSRQSDLMDMGTKRDIKIPGRREGLTACNRNDVCEP